MWESLLVVVGAFAATLLAFYINNIVFKPVLVVDKSSIEKVYDLPKGLRLVRLIVRNDGMRAATNCTVTLSIDSIRKEDVEDVELEWPGGSSSTRLRSDRFDSRGVRLEEENVPWSFHFREEDWAITINKGAVARAELFFIRENPNVDKSTLLLACLSKNQWRIGLRANRTYSGEIKITASNANPRRVKFTINRTNFNIVSVDPQSRGRLLRQLLPRQ